MRHCCANGIGLLLSFTARGPALTAVAGTTPQAVAAAASEFPQPTDFTPEVTADFFAAGPAAAKILVRLVGDSGGSP